VIGVMFTNWTLSVSGGQKHCRDMLIPKRHHPGSWGTRNPRPNLNGRSKENFPGAFARKIWEIKIWGVIYVLGEFTKLWNIWFLFIEFPQFFWGGHIVPRSSGVRQVSIQHITEELPGTATGVLSCETRWPTENTRVACGKNVQKEVENSMVFGKWQMVGFPLIFH